MAGVFAMFAGIDLDFPAELDDHYLLLMLHLLRTFGADVLCD